MAKGGQGRELPYMAMGSTAISHNATTVADRANRLLLDWLERKWLRLPLGLAGAKMATAAALAALVALIAHT